MKMYDLPGLSSTYSTVICLHLAADGAGQPLDVKAIHPIAGEKVQGVQRFFFKQLLNNFLTICRDFKFENIQNPTSILLRHVLLNGNLLWFFSTGFHKKKLFFLNENH